MKLKLLITILVLAALFSGVVLWRVDRFVYGDRMAWAEAQARGQLSSLSQAINGEIQSARRMLNTVSNDSFKRETANWKAFQPYYALALMTSQEGALGISRMVSKADSPAANWTAAELSQYIGFMGKELESKGTVLLRSFKGPEKEAHVAVIFAGGGNAYILVGSGENFQSLIESQRGSMSSFSIIASDGLMISHAMPDYIGSVMSDSTLLKEIRATGSAHGLGSYQQGKQRIFGMYELVPRTNTYVMSTVPMDELLKGRLSLAWQFGFMLVGLGFIGAAVYFWQEKKAGEAAAKAAIIAGEPVAPTSPALEPSVSYSPDMSPPPKSPRDIPTASPAVVTSNEVLSAPIAPREPTFAPPQAAPKAPPTGVGIMGGVITPQELRAEKAEAYRQVATALGHEMRAPLASILGFSQMVLAKTQEPEVVQAVESILREARSSRDVLEKLVTFTGERTSEKVEAKIEGPIMQALKNIDAQVQQKGVKIEKDFKETSPWPLAPTDISKAFENIFVNAIEAMERMQEKIIRVSAWEAGDGLHVSISDSGEGIEMENVSKVFDPFFTTRSFSQHVGLGLPVVVGILKEHRAQIQIQSQRGKGTQVEIIFAPKVVAASHLPKPPPPLPMRAPELPADLPRVSAPSEEDIALHDEALQESENPRPKITDMNVDNLLELQGDEMPLQFLNGQGFDDPPPTAPLPKVAPSRQTKPAEPPPLANTGMPGAQAQQVVLGVSEVSEEDSMDGATKVLASVVIDKPATPPPVAKNNGLNSYKVEVRRPGKRN